MVQDDMEPFALRLSQDELALLLEALEITQLAGNPLGERQPLPPEQAALVRPAVQRGLVARELLLPLAEGGWVVNGDVQRLLRLSAAPDAALLITSKSGDLLPPQQESYYRLGEVAVRSYQPYDGIYDFSALIGPLDLTASLLSWVQRYTAAADEPAYQVMLPQAALSQAQAAANRGATDQAGQLLQQAGASYAAGVALATAMTTPSARLQVATLSPHLQPPVHSVTLLCDAQRCWCIEANTEAAVSVITVGLEQVRNTLQTFIDQWAESG